MDALLQLLRYLAAIAVIVFVPGGSVMIVGWWLARRQLKRREQP